MTVTKLLIPRDEWKRCLTGTLEIACFLENGITRFSNTLEETLRSFWIVLIGFSLNCSAMLLLRGENEKLSSLPVHTMIYNDAQRIVFFNIFQVLLLYLLCKWWNRLEHFPRLITGVNWLQIIPLVVLAPLHLMVWTGLHAISDAGVLELIFVCYFLCAVAFFIGRSIKIPLVVAGYALLMMFMIDYISLMALLN